MIKFGHLSAMQKMALNLKPLKNILMQINDQIQSYLQHTNVEYTHFPLRDISATLIVDIMELHMNFTINCNYT